jgi:hypothetical protein
VLVHIVEGMPKRFAVVGALVPALALAACVSPSTWVANVYTLDGTLYMQKCTSLGCSTEEVGTPSDRASVADLSQYAPVELEREMVARALVDVKPTIDGCGAARDKKQFVSIAVKVTPDGAVDHVIVHDTDDPKLAECVALAVRGAHFPRTQKGGGFRYPLVL